ncbi:MAG: hypothetical protein GWN00_09485, partial [Aliifodinibius sp.]|nr:hypothetical protein [Fodinibius sp.]NIV11406.1 hypothetical protein [Fodinibius sp.]NIY25023.1 hypothetical protein [Fodinibius sp.]
MRVSDPFFTVQKADSFVVTPLMQNLQTNLHFPGHTDAIQMEYFHGKIVILESFLLNLRIFDPGDPGNYSSHIFFGNPRKFTTDGMRLAAFGGTMDSLELYTVDNNVNLNLAS